ncbi:helix-turn-helix domain-containing protein [Streptomyces werraensis]|uniref:helix-turn-helix domain-containing protein n=1 Tax=Streptomyces werraensis TaxID=68284 RepID=UPI001CE36FA2
MKFDAELARDGSVDPVDKALYAAIGSFVDAETRESPETTELDPNNIPPWVPTRKRLAECIGKSVDTVDRATKRLEDRGLLRVHRQPDPTNPRRMLPSEYELLDHHIWDERAAQRAAERAARKAGAGETRSSGGGRTGAATPGRTDAATPGRTGAAVKDLGEVVVEEEGGEVAPSARSARGVRSTSTSGSGARGRSGSAAPGKAGSSSEGAGTAVPVQRGEDALTREQTAAVHAVEALLPPVLVAKLPYGHIPKRNRAAVLEALESRTVEQLRERIARRWVAYGYEPAVYGGDLRSAVGAALELIRPTRYCPDLSCEDGTLIDTKADCRACAERKARRRADRLAGKAPAASSKGRGAAPECLDCGHPFPGLVPADGLCKPCREVPAATLAAFLAREEQAAAARREAEELEQEAQRRRARRAAEAAPAPAVEDVDQDQAAADAEEDARIRAELLAANPWMADFAQEPAAAAQGPAPF